MSKKKKHKQFSDLPETLSNMKPAQTDPFEPDPQTGHVMPPTPKPTIPNTQQVIGYLIPIMAANTERTDAIPEPSMIEWVRKLRSAMMADNVWSDELEQIFEANLKP